MSECSKSALDYVLLFNFLYEVVVVVGDSYICPENSDCSSQHCAFCPW